MDPQQQQHQATSPHLELIDVDCNLWHTELQEFLAQPPGETNEKDEDNEDDHRLMPNPWKLLENDAMICHDDGAESSSSSTSQIVAMVTPCSTLKDCRSAVATLQHYHYHEPQSTSQRRVQLGTTLGIHPYHVTDDDLMQLGSSESERIETAMQQLNDLLLLKSTTGTDQHNPNWVVAVGECGLDQAPGFPPLPEQIPWFTAQVQLAQERNRPLFVHERLASKETLEILQHHYSHRVGDSDGTSDDEDNQRRVIIHCFTGNAQELEQYLQAGYYISLAGGFLVKGRPQSSSSSSNDANSKKKSSPPDDNAVDLWNNLPRLWRDSSLSHRLMLETDAPYMGFASCRQHYLQHHADAIAQNLNGKKRKRLQSSTYPNVPSSLDAVLDLVCDCLNRPLPAEEGSDDSTATTKAELASITTRNARNFFGFE